MQTKARRKAIYCLHQQLSNLLQAQYCFAYTADLAISVWPRAATMPQGIRDNPVLESWDAAEVLIADYFNKNGRLIATPPAIQVIRDYLINH